MDQQAVMRNQPRTAVFGARWRRYIKLLGRKWWMLALAAALGLGAAYGWARLEPAHFVSSGRMMVDIKAAAPGGSVEERNNFLETQMGMIQSATVIGRAQTRMAAGKAGGGALPVAIKPSVQPRTTIIVLQGTGTDAQYTQGFVEACMEECINLRKEARAKSSEPTIAGLTADAAKLEKELRDSVDAIG